MSNNTQVRAEAKKLVALIEKLAHQVGDKLDNGSLADAMSAANELVKNNATFTFVLGSLYQEEKNPTQATKGKKKMPSMARSNYHNKRDQHGRFVSK